MRQTLENLRERPKDEKHTIAVSIALGVMAILLVGWLLYFFHSLVGSQASSTQAAVGSSAPSTDQNTYQATGTSTQFIGSATGTIQLEEVGSSSEPSL